MADNHGKCGILKKQINTYTRIKEPDDEPMSKIYIKKIALICIRVEESIKNHKTCGRSESFKKWRSADNKVTPV